MNSNAGVNPCVRVVSDIFVTLIQCPNYKNTEI